MKCSFTQLCDKRINETTKTIATGGALVVANTVVIGLSADASWAGTQGSVDGQLFFFLDNFLGEFGDTLLMVFFVAFFGCLAQI